MIASMLREDPDQRPELSYFFSLPFLAKPVARHRAIVDAFMDRHPHERTPALPLPSSAIASSSSAAAAAVSSANNGMDPVPTWGGAAISAASSAAVPASSHSQQVSGDEAKLLSEQAFYFAQPPALLLQQVGVSAQTEFVFDRTFELNFSTQNHHPSIHVLSFFAEVSRLRSTAAASGSWSSWFAVKLRAKSQ
jgi:hypothetical protein